MILFFRSLLVVPTVYTTSNVAVGAGNLMQNIVVVQSIQPKTKYYQRRVSSKFLLSSSKFLLSLDTRDYFEHCLICINLIRLASALWWWSQETYKAFFVVGLLRRIGRGVLREFPTDFFNWHGMILVPSWISNHMPCKVWGEINYPFPNSSSYRWCFRNGQVISSHML